MAWYNLARAYSDLGRPRRAARAYRSAIRLSPGDHESWNNLGNSLVDVGDFDEAIDCYEKALDLAPDYDPSWNNLGVALDEAGDPAGAARAYAEAQRANPHRPTYLLNRASALARTGRREDAMEHLGRALEVEPDLLGLVASFPEFEGLLCDLLTCPSTTGCLDEG
jgi:tetratricopeptide (TPR) repeat protein